MGHAKLLWGIFPMNVQFIEEEKLTTMFFIIRTRRKVRHKLLVIVIENMVMRLYYLPNMEF
jgi:hypothetical protein